MQCPQRAQATKNLKIDIGLTTKIKESEREYLASNAVSPEDSPEEMKIEEDSPEPQEINSKQFKLNI